MDSDLSGKRSISANVFCTSEEGIVLIILIQFVGENKRTNNSAHRIILEFFWAKTIRSIQSKFTNNTQVIHQIFNLLNLFCIYLVKHKQCLFSPPFLPAVREQTAEYSTSSTYCDTVILKQVLNEDGKLQIYKLHNTISAFLMFVHRKQMKLEGDL